MLDRRHFITGAGGLTERPPQLETPFSVFDEGPIPEPERAVIADHLAAND